MAVAGRHGMLDLQTRRHMLILQRGLSLIEVLIALAIVAVGLAIGGPDLGVFMVNSKARSLASSFLNGLQLARTTAIARNRPMVLYQGTGPANAVTGLVAISTTGADWAVLDSDPAGVVAPQTALVASDSGKNGGAAATTTVAPLTPLAYGGQVEFNGLGLPLGMVGGAFTPLAATLQINFQPTAMPGNGGGTCAAPTAGYHCYAVTIRTTGQVRMCAPDVAAPDPRAC